MTEEVDDSTQFLLANKVGSVMYQVGKTAMTILNTPGCSFTVLANCYPLLDTRHVAWRRADFALTLFVNDFPWLCNFGHGTECM